MSESTARRSASPLPGAAGPADDQQAGAPGARRSGGGRSGQVARYAFGFATLVLVINAIVGEKGLLTLRKARRDLAQVEASLEVERRRNAHLRDEAIRLREDPRAVEELARRDLGLMRPGEKVFIVRAPDPGPRSDRQCPQSQPKCE